MESDVLIRYALDNTGHVIPVKDAIKGQTYYCPECGDRLKYRHGEIRRPHFAHINGEKCTNESTLHAIFKKKVAELFTRLINEGKAFPISWSCPECGVKFDNVNLLHRVSSVKEEFSLGPCRPDVALLDKNGKVVIAFEVVVTHAPEEEVVKYYKESGIVLVTVNLDRDEELDLNDIGGIIASRSKVDFCRNRVCSFYLPTAIQRKVIFTMDHCKGCGMQHFRAKVHLDTPFGDSKNLDLTHEEIREAEAVYAQKRVPCKRVAYKQFSRECVTVESICKCSQRKTYRPRPSDPLVPYRGKQVRLSTIKKKYFD